MPCVMHECRLIAKAADMIWLLSNFLERFGSCQSFPNAILIY